MVPVLFTLGWIDVPSFTALMVMALGVGLALTWWQARRMNLSTTHTLDVAFIAVLLGVIGARAVHVAANWEYFRAHTREMVFIWSGGLWWQGGVMGGALGAAIASSFKLPTRKTLNALTPGLMAGAALGWLGCYIAGVAYGREIFPGDFWWFLAADWPDAFGLWNPRCVTQILGAAWAIACCGLALLTQRSKWALTFAMTMTVYSFGMIALGFTRGDPVPMLGIWRWDQVLDAGIALAAVVYGLIDARHLTLDA